MFLELLNSILRDAAFLGIYDHTNKTNTCVAYRNVSSSETLNKALEMYREETSGNGLAGVLIFVFLLLIPLLAILGIIIICYIISGCSSDPKTRKLHHSPLITLYCSEDTLRDHSHMSYITGIVQSVLVIFYFVGDNLGPVLVDHGGDIGCTGKCSENAAVIIKVISVGAIQLFHSVPYLLKHCVILIKHDSDWKYDEERSALAAILGNIVMVDAAYTSLTGLTIVSNFCGDTEHGLNWTLLAFCAVAGAIYITLKIINSQETEMNIKKTLLSGILLTVLLLSYLTGDNATPLDCAFHCSDGGPSNEDMTHPPLERYCCNIRGNIITRLFFTSLALVVSIVVVAGVVVTITAKQPSKVAPRPSIN